MFRNATNYELIQNLERHGNLIVVPDDRWQARKNESEIRAIEAGCLPIAEKKLVATEVEGWREVR